MNLLAPHRLWLLVPVAALAVAYVVLQRRRRRYAVRFTNLDLLDSIAPKRPGWRRHVAAALAGIAAMAMVVGLARPVAAMEVATEDAVVVLAIDTSMSMQATDVAPTRIDAAVHEAVTFVESLPDSFQIGLVSFAGTAQVLAAPTDDHAAVIAAIEALTTGKGTAGGDALQAALTSIESTLADTAIQALAGAADAAGAGEMDDAPAATVVMLSDGATTAGADVVEAAQEAADAGIPVSTITYGSAAGTLTIAGETMPVPPDTESMAEVAELTGGTAFAAATADDLAAVYADIEARIGTTIEERELAPAFVAAGLAALLAAAAAAFAWTGRFL
jgi:Ca-activated chloride channel family protein